MKLTSAIIMNIFITIFYLLSIKVSLKYIEIGRLIQRLLMNLLKKWKKFTTKTV